MHLISESQLNLNHNEPNYDDGGLAVESTKPALKKPSMYGVYMLNDDYTPMEFVIDVLQRFFAKDVEQATQIMLAVHTKGSALCAIYTKDIAETKALLVTEYARECQHPLVCDVAPVEE